MNNGLIDSKALKEFCIQYKMQALEKEKRVTGTSKDMLAVQIQTIEAFLMVLLTEMRESDMTALKFRLDEAPVPTSQLRARSVETDELATFLIEVAPKVPKGMSQKIETGGIDADKVASKMWALRDQGVLPMHITPKLKTDPKTKERHVYIAHRTEQELASMRKGRGGKN